MLEKNINFDLNKGLFFNLEDLDLVIKFLYVKAKIENNNYHFYKKLYEKSILRCYGWVNDWKNKISEFVESFDRLIESIKNDSFDNNYPIILSTNNMILNGRHRLAICMYLNVEASFEIRNDLGHKRYIIDVDFFKTVFSEFETETIILDYLNNFKNEDYFITFLWWDSEKNWSYIEETFKKNNCIIGYQKTFKFTEKRYFENILEGLYTYENGIKQNGNIFIKTEGLKKNMKFKIILLKYEKEKTYRSINKGFPICIEIEEIKFKIREKLSLSSVEKNYSFLHTSDNYDHTRYLCNFLFNDNIHLLKKISKHNKYMNSTNKFLIEFATFLKNNQLDRYNFCFESWIILQIFGIRKAADLDFICVSKLRNQLKLCTINIDLHKENRFYGISKLSDDAIIKNRENYFFYKGFKFIIPTLLIQNTSHLSKKKSLDMLELQNFINKDKEYDINIIYKIKISCLLKYYWFRRRVIDILAIIFTKKQKYLIKVFLNKYCSQNYNLEND